MKKKKIKNAFFEISYFSLYVIMKNTTTGDLLIFLYQCIKIKSSLLIYKTSSSWTDSLAFPIMDDIASRKDIDMTQTHMMRGIVLYCCRCSDMGPQWHVQPIRFYALFHYFLISHDATPFRKRHYPRFPRRLYGSPSSLCALARYKRFFAYCSIWLIWH
jgi:hypothetical protein